jgi:DNA-binding SARP family transcriptional activator
MSKLRICMLGPFNVWRNEEPVPVSAWRNQQTRIIFKVLLTHRGHVVSIDQLLEILWPDDHPDAARRRLHVRISQLRHILDPDNPSAYILTAKGGYSFNPEADRCLDIVEFETCAKKGRRFQEEHNFAEAITAYEAACTLYKGDFLEEDLYEDWTFAQRERLRERFLMVLTELAECYAQQGRYRRTIARCHQVLTVDPCRETVYVRLMLYHYYAGEQVQALRTYERCCQVLAEELDVEPLPTTTVLAQQIRDGTLWAADNTPRYPPPLYEGRLFEVPYSLGFVPFVGREREYAWLIEQWREAQINVILIEGEAGVGKSRLVDEFLGYVQAEGATVLQTRTALSERVPYTSAVAALHPLLGSRKSKDIPSITLAALARLFPEVRTWRPDLPSLPELPGQQEQNRLFEAVETLVQACAPSGTLLFVDDAHRADAISLDLLAHLAGMLTVVLACRTEETPSDHPLRIALRPLRRKGRLAELTLKQLSLTAVQALISQLTTEDLPTLTKQVVVQAEGNPLFVIALLQHMFEQGALYVDAEGRWSTTEDIVLSLPPTMREVIAARLRRLSHSQRRVFDLAAVIGGDFDFALLQHASQMEEDSLLDTLDRLVETGLLIEPRLVERGEFMLAHDCYAEVAYDTLPRVRRRRLHRQVAEALLSWRGDEAAMSAAVAYHYYRGGQPAEAVRFEIQAGQHALELYAGQEAADHFEHAFKWAEEAGQPFDGEQLAEIHFNWGTALQRSGRYDEAIRHLAQALPLAQGVLRQTVVHRICSAEAIRGDGGQAFRRLADSIEPEILSAGDTWALVSLYWARGVGAAVHGDVGVARACSAAGWRVARRLVAGGDKAPLWLEGRGYLELARCHEWWADWRHTIRYAGKALMVFTACNDPHDIAASHLLLGMAYYGLGVWDRALYHFEQAHRVAIDAGDPCREGEALYRAGLVHLERGDLATTQENARHVLASAESTGDSLQQGFGHYLLAHIAMRQGASQEAITKLQVLEQVARAAEATLYGVVVLRYLAEAHLLADDLEAALTTARKGSELARESGMKREWGGLLRILGEVLAQSGELQAAERYLQRAAALAERIGCRHDLAEAHRSLGRLCGVHGTVEATREHFDTALTLFEELGAKHDTSLTQQLWSDFVSPLK